MVHQFGSANAFLAFGVGLVVKMTPKFSLP